MQRPNYVSFCSRSWARIKQADTMDSKEGVAHAGTGSLGWCRTGSTIRCTEAGAASKRLAIWPEAMLVTGSWARVGG